MRLLAPGARALVSAALAATMFVSASPPASVAAAVASSEVGQVLRIARAQLGDRYRFGSTGPSAFDCSGLVIYTYRMAGDLAMIGNGRYRSAAELYRYFRARGKVSRTRATPGDLVIWGNGKHVGIYLGRGMAISALNGGVRIHAVNALTLPFTAYLRTGIYQRGQSAPVVAPTPTPLPTATTLPTPTPTPAETPTPTATPTLDPSPIPAPFVTPEPLPVPDPTPLPLELLSLAP